MISNKNICFTTQKYLGEKHLPAGPEVLGAAAADPGHDLLRRRGRARPRAHHLQRHGQVGDDNISLIGEIFPKPKPSQSPEGGIVVGSEIDWKLINVIIH